MSERNPFTEEQPRTRQLKERRERIPGRCNRWVDCRDGVDAGGGVGMKVPFLRIADVIIMDGIDKVYEHTTRPFPDRVTFDAFEPGKSAGVTVTYVLDHNDNRRLLKQWLNNDPAFDEAVAASTDGTVKVRFE